MRSSIEKHSQSHASTSLSDFYLLLGRVATAPSGSLNLFTNKEQEFELRVQLLKRLSFAILCSPLDQYQRNMPEIQGLFS